MTASEKRNAITSTNIREKATLIWNVANTLFGAFKPHEYGLVILPMVVCCRPIRLFWIHTRKSSIWRSRKAF